MHTEVRRLFVLLCGYEILPKSVSTRDRGAQFMLCEPVCVYLLDTVRGWVLLDAGLNPDNLDDPERRAALFTDRGMIPPIVRQQHRIEPQLREIGIALEDIEHVILSHLHFDHSGYIGRLRHARLSIQRRELETAMTAPTLGYIPSDYDLPGLRWDVHDGDWQAMPGLQLLDTRGHTAGHQSALVTLPHSTILLPFDAGDLAENFDDEVLPGESCDDEAAMAAIRRLKAIRQAGDVEMLLFHDPIAIQHMRLAPLFYR